MEDREYAEIKRRVLDEEHLRLLAIFHFVLGGLNIFMALFFLLYTTIMSLVLGSIAVSGTGADADAAQAIGIFATVFGVFAFLILVYGVLLIVSGVLMRRRKARLFSFILAIPNLLSIPWGTLLSVFTFIVLSRESVKSMYASAQAPT